MSSADIILRKGHPVGLNRYTPGAYVDGKYDEGPTDNFTIIMSIQPLNGKEMLQLSEGQRTRNYVKGYCAERLNVANIEDSIRADIIVDDGVFFEVQSCEPWVGDGTGIGNFWKVLLAEVNTVLP